MSSSSSRDGEDHHKLHDQELLPEDSGPAAERKFSEGELWCGDSTFSEGIPSGSQLVNAGKADNVEVPTPPTLQEPEKEYPVLYWSGNDAYNASNALPKHSQWPRLVVWRSSRLPMIQIFSAVYV